MAYQHIHRLGFTLLELLVVVAIAAITLSVGAPPLGHWLAEKRLESTLQALQADLQRARHEAVVRNQSVVVCGSADGATCDGADWAGGWLMFVNVDNEHPAAPDAIDTVLARYEPHPGVRIRSNRAAYSFRGDLRRATNGSVVACDRREGNAAGPRMMVVSFTGRARLTPKGTTLQSLDCNS